MATAWAFYPHPSGTKTRGLALNAGTISWAACRTNDTRSVSIYLPGPPNATLDVEDPGVVEVSYGKTSVQGFYPVNVKSVGPGTSYIEAYRGDTDYTWMYVTVYPKLAMHLSFKRVETEKWKSNLTIGKMQRLVENLNYIYSYQGNISFTAIGTPKKVTIPGLDNVISTDIVSTWTPYRDSGADSTVFFVKETDALAVNWSDLVIMEDSQTRPWDEMTCAHELGHRMNLRHPAPSISFNLMNQTSVGDRDRMKIFLTRTQIETVTTKSNWKQIQSQGTDADTCEMPR
jgi:hypothetical protein